MVGGKTTGMAPRPVTMGKRGVGGQGTERPASLMSWWRRDVGDSDLAGRRRAEGGERKNPAFGKTRSTGHGLGLNPSHLGAAPPGQQRLSRRQQSPACNASCVK